VTAYLAKIHNNTLVYFLPQMSPEDLNQGDLQCWNFTVHKDASQIKLDLETNINLHEKKT